MVQTEWKREHPSVYTYTMQTFVYASWHFLLLALVVPIITCSAWKQWRKNFYFIIFYHNIFDPKMINKNTRENESVDSWGALWEKKLSYLGYSGPLQGFFPEGKDRTSGPWSNFLFIWRRTRGETKTLVTVKAQKWEILYLKARGNLLDINSTPFW